MSNIVEKFKIVTYTLLHSIETKKKKILYANAEGKRIGLVFQQIFGDALLFSSTFNAYNELFPTEKGYVITILCLPVVKKFLEETVDIPDTFNVIAIDFKKAISNYNEFRRVINYCEEIFDIAIVPGSSASAEILIGASKINTKIGLVQHRERKWPPYLALIQKYAYTEVVRPDREMMVLERYRFFLNYLGLKDFKARLPRLKERNNKICLQHNYCVIAPGASKDEKCWPIERFASICEFIIEKYNLDIYICGGTDEKKYFDNLMKIYNSGRIHDLTGKTTFGEWSAVVQHAKLVLGNDSATLHLAAASSRRAICIAGVYDKGHFFPYVVDEIDEKDRLPITIMHDMPCEYCRTIGYYSGYNNKKCKNAIKSGRCALCLEAITTNEVKCAIDEIMKEDF